MERPEVGKKGEKWRGEKEGKEEKGRRDGGENKRIKLHEMTLN